MQLRCDHRIHGIVREENRLEVKCTRRACGVVSGVVVLHYFDLTTGELVDTKKFSDPVVERKEQQPCP